MSETSPLPSICEGVFFSTPSDLPRGRHDLDRADVIAAQRERLMIAMTERLAESGYRRVSVRDATTRARVSQAAFYECFDDKDACIYSAYDRFISVLLDRVQTAIEHERDSENLVLVTSIITAYLNTLDADPVTARAFQVEMEALGGPARKRRRDALVGMAHVLRSENERRSEGGRVASDSAYVGAVYAIRQLASDLLDSSDGTPVSPLAAECSEWIAAMLDMH